MTRTATPARAHGARSTQATRADAPESMADNRLSEVR